MLCCGKKIDTVAIDVQMRESNPRDGVWWRTALQPLRQICLIGREYNSHVCCCDSPWKRDLPSVGATEARI